MQLTLVTGPMFAGKTSFLMEQIKQHQHHNSIIVTHSSDTRFSKDDTLVNHDGKSIQTKIYRVDSLKELPSIDKDKETFIGIDEAQFFPDIISYIYNFKKNKFNKLTISVCGLSGDFQ